MKEYASYKVILIVNVANNDGFTYSNYNELMDLHERFNKHVSSNSNILTLYFVSLKLFVNDQGFQILAFPCDQFGVSEPGSDSDIQRFITNYGIPFPVFSKVYIS